MKRVLVVEDNSALRENTVELLEMAGFEVLQAANGKEAHEQVLKSQPDVIACDVIMPELDGHGFLKLLKAEEGTREIPIVFFSIDHVPDFLKEEIKAGKIVYLLKPFSTEDLLGAINKCLNHNGK